MRPVCSAVLLCLTLASSGAPAQTKTVPPFELERVQLDPGGEGTITHGLGELLPAWHYRVSLALHYEKNPLTLTGAGGYEGALVKDRFTTHLAFALAFHDRVRVGLHFPVFFVQSGDDLTGAGWSNPTGAGVGTPYVSAAFGLLLQRKGAPLDLSTQLSFGIPLGTQAALGSGTTVSLIPSVAAGRNFGMFKVGGEVALAIKPDAVLAAPSPASSNVMGRELLLSAALATVGYRLQGELSAKGAINLHGIPGSLELLLGGRYELTEAFEVFALLGPGFGVLPGTPSFRLMLGVAFNGAFFKDPSADACAPGQPHTPGKCPDDDDDGDGIRNADDHCIGKAGPERNKGCPEVAVPAVIPIAARDTDGDGVPDSEDNCVDKPGKKEWRGCSTNPEDTDGDGIEDVVDGCPTVPGKLENLGCPELDSDGDGLSDRTDKCPKVPGPVENQGCPPAKKQRK